MNYYYLASSLPPVTMDEAPSLSLADFLELCEDHVTEMDLHALRAALDDSTACNHPAVLTWREKNTQLRNMVAKARAHRKKLDPTSFVRAHEDFDTGLEQAVDEAFAINSPLGREKALDACRWSLIGEIEGFNEFSSTALVGYALKLRLTERWASLDEETGQHEMNSMVNRPSGDEGIDNSADETS